jgi:hypothetical protein
MVTRSPRHLSSRPSEDAVRPLPKDDETPPVKKMYLVARFRGSDSGDGALARSPVSVAVLEGGSTVGSPPEGCGGPSTSGT